MELVIPPVQKVSQMLSIRFFISPVIMGGLFSLTYKDTNLEVNHKGGAVIFRGSGGFYRGLEVLAGLAGLEVLDKKRGRGPSFFSFLFSFSFFSFLFLFPLTLLGDEEEVVFLAALCEDVLVVEEE